MAGRAHHKVAGKLCHPVLALEEERQKQ